MAGGLPYRTGSGVSEVINEQDECGGYVALKALVTEGLSSGCTKGPSAAAWFALDSNRG